VVGVSGFRKHTGHGTPQQKERFLNPLLNGEKRICFSMTEKAAGADRLNTSSDEMVLHPRIGSLALRFCRVAQGNLDAAFAGGQSHDWDLAAADPQARAANKSPGDPRSKTCQRSALLFRLARSEARDQAAPTVLLA
jgi:fructose-1,6-bisphosphatase/inositol monophosphatase family enzyme